MQILSKYGAKKIHDANTVPINYFIRAIMAGMFLGVAMILSYSLGSLFQDNPALSKTLVAFTFGIGIVVIIFLKTELFTGNCFTTAITLYNRECTWKELLPTWGLCYLGNAVGIIFIIVLFTYTQSSNVALTSYLESMMSYKLNFDIGTLFVKAVLCNFIVCMCTYISYKVKSESAKTLIIIFLIAAFYIPGFEHCIANFGTFTMALMDLGTLAFSDAALHTLISTLGNIVGGTLLFAIPMFILMKNDAKKEQH